MKKRIIATCLAIVSAFGLFGGCGKKETKIPDGPDYSASTKQFDFYGYSALIDGWNIDGVDYDVEEDYLSVERIKEYKDAGMTIYFPQSAAAVNESTPKDWANSAAKRALDYSLEAGIDKVILCDYRIQSLTKTSFGTDAQIKAMIENGTIYEQANYGLIGEGKEFATEAELDSFVESCLSLYIDHEAFYGIMLGDEPFFYHSKSYGEMYRSIERVSEKLGKDVYIQYNLNPIGIANGAEARSKYCPPLENTDGMSEEELMIAAYEAYLKLFMDATGAEYLQFDHYPLYSAEKVTEIYLVGLQIAAKVAKEYDAEFYFVTQTFNMTDGSTVRRSLSEADLYWLNNMLLGFGIKQISYFTYFTKADNNREHFKDGQSFLTWEGEKTDIYYWMQNIMKEEQKFAPTILNFDYVTSKVFSVDVTTFNSGHVMTTLDTPELSKVTSVTVNKEIALVTELYDDEKGNYMYMLQNVVDPAKKGSKAFQTLTVTFDKAYKYAAVYVKGERTNVKLDKGTLTVKQKPGEATYVIPY
ncbi:MAG: hypothetical protein IJZ32_05470 [Clostridia bacterium]|nr:hypothetical protein [Clostridia bacterium]